MKGFPHKTFPTGWFQVGWSPELVSGDVRPMHYFGRDLVSYRGESGDVHVMDAHCPHLGAHMGHGGKVLGDDIRCPFHGWRWDCTGRNVDIPYSERVNQSKRVRVWHTREMNGAIFVWFDELGEEPKWEPPAFPELDDRSLYYPPYPNASRLYASAKMQPQYLVENVPDVAHFEFVHKAQFPPVIEHYAMEGHTARFVLKYIWGRRKTEMTPEGPVEGRFSLDLYGMGIIAATVSGFHDIFSYANVTPVDEDHSDYWISFWLRRFPGDENDEPTTGRAKAIVDGQFKQAEEDLPIWAHMEYATKPPLVSEEAKPYVAVRRWCEQFYPAEHSDR